MFYKTRALGSRSDKSMDIEKEMSRLSVRWYVQLLFVIGYRHACIFAKCIVTCYKLSKRLQRAEDCEVKHEMHSGWLGDAHARSE